MNNYFGIYVQALLAKNAANSLQKQLNKIKDLQIKVNPTFGKINNSELNRINKELEGQLKSKLEDVGKIDITPEIDQEAVNKVDKSISGLADGFKKDLSPAVEDAGEKFSFFGNMASRTTDVANNLMGTVGKVAVWTVATGAIFSTRRALQDLFSKFVELEDKLISIARVSDNLDISKIFSGAYASANKYGAKLMDMLESTEEIARSYNDLNEAQVLAAAEAGILASTIADMDGGDAVGTIIAVSNAYGLAVENGEKLIDMLNEVDNNFAVTSADIATAWERSAATAKTFGVELHTLTGYITAISSVTQEAGTVIGNGLKTIMSRITTLPAAMDEIKAAGVDIFDGITGQVRPVEAILADLAEKWDTLSASQQQNLGVQVAGRYQLTRFLALMNNWEIAVDASTTALSSEGSAARENAIYLESYTAKLNKLENAQSQLAYTLQDGSMSTIGKTWLDLKITLVEVTDTFFKVADSTTFVVGSMIGLIGFLAKTANGYQLLLNVLKFVTTETKAKAIADNIAEKGLIKNRLASILSTAAHKLEAAAIAHKTAATNINTGTTTGNAVAQYGLAAACNVAATAVSWLSKALFSIPGLAIVAGIAMLAKVFIDKANAAKEATKALREEAAAVSSSKQEISTYVKKLQDLIKLKKELNRTEYDETYGEDETKYLDALAEKYTKISDELKSQNHSLEYKLKLIEEEDAKLAKQAKKDYESKRDTSNLRVIQQAEETYVDRDLSGWEKFGNFLGFTNTKSLEGLRKEFDDIIIKGQEYYKLSGDITQAENEYINQIKEKGLAVAKSRDDMYDVMMTVEQLQEAYKDAGEQGIEPFKQALLDIGLSQKEIDKIMTDTQDIVESASYQWDMYKAALDEASEGLAEFNNNSRDVTDMFFGVADGTEEAIENMTMYMDMFGEKSSMVKNMADDLANSFVFMGEKIFQNGEDLMANRDKLNMISDTLAIAKSNQEFYAKSVAEGTLYVAKGYEQEWEAVRSAKIAELTVEKEALENKIKIWKAVIDGTKTMAEANAELTKIEAANNNNRVKSLRDYWESFKSWVKGIVTGYKSVSQASSGDVEKAQANLDALNVRLNDVNTSIKQWTDIKIVGTTVDDFKKLGDAAGGASGKTIDYFKLAEEALLKYKAAVEAIDNELKILQEKNKQLVVGSQAWFDNYAQQEKVIKRMQSSIKEYIKQVEVQLKNDKLNAEEKVKLQNIIQDLNLEYEKLNTTLHNNVEAQKKFYESQITEKLKLIQDLEKQRHKEALDNIKKERQAFQDQIKEQINLMKKASAARNYEKELNELQAERLNILSQISRLEGDDSRLAKSRLSDLYKELEAVEEKISDLNYERNNELREDALNDLSEELDSYYDNLEEMENQKNEMITDAIDSAKDSLDIANQTISELIAELDKWGSTLSNFSTWAQNFDSLVKTMPTSNIVSAMVPVNEVDGEGNVTTTQVIFNITGSSSDAKNISDEIVDNLIKAGVITTGNG